MKKFLNLLVFLTTTFNCSSQSVSKAEQSELTFEWLDDYVQAFHQERGFSGVVLIAKGDEIVFKKAIGWQDVGKGVSNKIDTRFNLGSGNKMFTAIAITQLQEVGKLKFDDPIINYLPDYPNRTFAETATIHNLLTHTSGLGDYWDDEYELEWHKITTVKEKLPFVVELDPLFKPGEGRAYSNSGFVLLGLIIEKVSGLSYFDYIRKHIYQPSGMQMTDSYEKNGATKTIATAYLGNGSKWSEAPYALKGSSDGGGYSTVEDMLKFSSALRNNLLISASSLEMVQTDKTPNGEKNLWNYGYGFRVEKVNGQMNIGHGGKGYGVYFNYRYFPVLGYTVILFSNSESGSPDVLFSTLKSYITDNEKERNAFIEGIPTLGGRRSFDVELIVNLSEDDEIKVLDESTDDDVTIYWEIIEAVTKSFDSKDIDSFNSLFEKQDVVTTASNESMFNFVINLIPTRGRIEKFHDLSPPIELPDSKFSVRIATFHLEDGYPGSITLSLNEGGKIDHFSLFVHPQICKNGPDKNCQLATMNTRE